MIATLRGMSAEVSTAVSRVAAALRCLPVWLAQLAVASLLPLFLLAGLLRPSSGDLLLPLVYNPDVVWGRPGMTNGPSWAAAQQLPAPFLAPLASHQLPSGHWHHQLQLRPLAKVGEAVPRSVSLYFRQPPVPVDVVRAEILTKQSSLPCLRSDFRIFQPRPPGVEHVMEFSWPVSGGTAPGDNLLLIVETRTPAELALWVHGSTNLSGETSLLQLVPQQPVVLSKIQSPGLPPMSLAHSNAIVALLPCGHLTIAAPPSGDSRLAVLAKVWGFGRASELLVMLAGGCGLFAVAMFAWPSVGGRKLTSLRVGAAMASAFLGLGIIYAVVCPPFQGPDEHYHYISFSKAVQHTNVLVAGKALAARAHLERLSFRPHQNLNAQNLDEPNTGWHRYHDSVPETPGRSGLVYRYWRLMWHLLRGMPEHWLLLALRLINAAVASLSIGLAAWLLVRLKDDGWSDRFALGLCLTIPSLPFFTMFLSNYSPYFSAAILASGALSAVVLGRSPTWLGSLLLGVTLGSLAHISRGALLVLPVFGLALMAGALLPSLATPSAGSLFLGRVILGIGLLLPRLATTPEYDANLRAELGPVLHLSTTVSLAAIYLAAVCSLVAVLIGCDVVRLVIGRQQSRPMIGRLKWPGFRRMWPAVVLLLLLFSALPMPETPVVEYESPRPLGRGEYVLHCLGAWLTSFGWTRQDFAVSRSFWGGFGWLDVTLPKALVFGPALLLLSGWAHGCSGKGGVPTPLLAALRAWVLFGIVLLGLSALMLGAIKNGYSIRGRYLMPMLMLGYTLAGVWTSRWVDGKVSSSSHLQSATGFGIVATIHGLTLLCLMNRYL
jgi:hypothetical protein